MIDRTTDILGLVDVQPTFMPGGELAVADGHAVIRAINQIVESAGPDAMFGSELAGGVRIDTSRLAQAAYADGANTSRTGNLFFGPLPDKRLAITQAFYDRFTPAIATSDFALRPGPLERALDFLAVCRP